MRKVLIIGGTSAIAVATARLFARQGDRLFLVGRTEQKLRVVADDLRMCGAEYVGTSVLDVNEFEQHVTMLQKAAKQLDGFDTALIAHGTLSDQNACEATFGEALGELRTNFISVISLLTHVANQFEQQGYGTIAVISSVAGDRGRQSNYLYGTAKGAISTFLQGLRARLHKAGVRVVTLKLGCVDTPMTAHMPKHMLYAQPETVAKGIYRAINSKRDVTYIPWFWRPIMLIINSMPEQLFKRLQL